MSMMPSIVLEFIDENERQRQVNAEGCKPDYNTNPTRAVYRPTQTCQEKQV